MPLHDLLIVRIHVGSSRCLSVVVPFVFPFVLAMDVTSASVEPVVAPHVVLLHVVH